VESVENPYFLFNFSIPVNTLYLRYFPINNSFCQHYSNSIQHRFQQRVESDVELNPGFQREKCQIFPFLNKKLNPLLKRGFI